MPQIHDYLTIKLLSTISHTLKKFKKTYPKLAEIYKSQKNTKNQISRKNGTFLKMLLIFFM